MSEANQTEPRPRTPNGVGWGVGDGSFFVKQKKSE